MRLLSSHRVLGRGVSWIELFDQWRQAALIPSMSIQDFEGPARMTEPPAPREFIAPVPAVNGLAGSYLQLVAMIKANFCDLRENPSLVKLLVC
jgi:hypothetical protein